MEGLGLMPQTLERDIRERLAHYLAGDSTLERFQDWFVPATWNVAKSGPQGAARLAYAIDLRLAEYSNGDWLESELQKFFRDLLTNVDVGCPASRPSSSTSAVNL